MRTVHDASGRNPNIGSCKAQRRPLRPIALNYENDKQKGKELQQIPLAKFYQPEIRAGTIKILERLESYGANPAARNWRLRKEGEKECKRDEAGLKAGFSNGNEKENEDSGIQSSTDKRFNVASACLQPKKAALEIGNDEENQEKNDENEDQIGSSDEELKNGNGSGIRGSRKEKSLGLLSLKFLDNVLERRNSKGCVTIHLEAIAEELRVSKRRIYDVVNVLEAFRAMEKSTKGNYEWRGLKHLPTLLYKLRLEAIAEELAKKVDRLKDKMAHFESFNDDGKKTLPVIEKKRKAVKTKNDSGISSSSDDQSRAKSSAKISKRIQRPEAEDKRNTLVHLCVDFIKILIAGPNGKFNRPVSMDVASTLLISEPGSEADKPPSRSRCRRLYDVANVLNALGLVTKSHCQFGTKKIPLYTYCGPDPSETAEFDFEGHLKLLSSTKAKDNAEATATMQEDEKPHDLFQKKSDLGKRSGVSADSEALAAKRLRTDEKEDETKDYTVEPFARCEPDVSTGDFSSPPTSANRTVSVVRPQAQLPTGVNSEATSILLPSAASTSGALRERQENSAGEHAFRPPERHSNSACVTQGHLDVERAFQQNTLPYAFAPTSTHIQQMNIQRFLALQLMNFMSSPTNASNSNGVAATVLLPSTAVDLRQRPATSAGANNNAVATTSRPSTVNAAPTAAMNPLSTPHQSNPRQQFSVESLLNSTDPNAASYEDFISLGKAIVDAARRARPPIAFILLNACLNFIRWYVANYETQH